MNPKKGIYRHFILYPLRLLMPILAKKKKLNNKKKPNNIKGVKKEELAKEEKPLGLNGRNSGTQAYKIVKGPQKKQMGPTKLQRRK